jgi:hypothetical protein
MTFLLWYSIVILSIQMILVIYSREYIIPVKILAILLDAPILVYIILSA